MKRRKKEKSAVLIRLKLLRLRRKELVTRGRGAGRSLETENYRQQGGSSRYERDSKRLETDKSSHERSNMLANQAFSQRWVTLLMN